MKRAITAHLRDFIAILAMIVVALITLLVILSNQKAALPGWVPGLGQSFYSINARYPTAQAVTPGQGQEVVIAGIQVGKVGAVSLDHGTAKVRLDIEPKYKDLLHGNASSLLRPKTGLNDMVVEVDPGTKGPPPAEGSTLPTSRGVSNVQADQFLNTLDSDTRDYLALLLNGAGEGLGGEGENLSKTLRRFEPFTRYTAELNGTLAKRRDNIKQSIHAFSQIATELGNNDQAVGDFVTASNASLGNFAAEQASLREALAEFPSTLAATRTGLAKSNRLSEVLKPALLGLIPGAKNLKSSLRSAQGLFKSTTVPIREDIRPFTRQTQPVFRHLSEASKPLAKTSKALTGTFTNLNDLVNLLAYNPPGDSQEGYLFWLPWMNHDMNASINGQDAHGPIRRGISMGSCNTAIQEHNVAPGAEQLETAYQLVQLAPYKAICPPETWPPEFDIPTTP